jgi:hypothetical protein
MRALRFFLAASIAALALLGTAVAPVLADVCFNAAGIEIVGHAFIKAGRGACRPFTGTALSFARTSSDQFENLSGSPERPTAHKGLVRFADVERL